MNTKLVRVDVESLQDEAKKSQSLQILKEAGEIIKNGGLVAFPTETVYGLGGDALNPESSRKIYAAKGRPSDNPLIVHIADMEHLERITESIPEAAYTLVITDIHCIDRKKSIVDCTACNTCIHTLLDHLRK